VSFKFGGVEKHTVYYFFLFVFVVCIKFLNFLKTFALLIFIFV
jgi:hypothetical protein